MELEFPIHHVIVIGFHHKKGCQIEFAYPPFEIEIEKTAWKYLPTLAMPDGAHNFASDTVYFHLPSLKNPSETVYGVACYQQIDASKLKNKTEDVTRSTVQKSVCVLSKYPLYGHIQVKMSLITAAYFREGDFAQVSILEEAYHNLNACLTPDLLGTPETFTGLSPRELVFLFRHQVLILLKLLLLEKRILFRGASVGPLCSALLSLVSLLPLSVEYGLTESACARTEKTLSIVPQFSYSSEDVDGGDTSSQHIQEAKCEDKEKTDSEKPSPTIENSQQKSQMEKVKEETGEPKEKKTKDLINSSLIQGSVSPRNVDSTDNARSSQQTSMDVTYCVSENSVKSGLSDRESDTFSVSSEKLADDIPDFITAVQLTAADAGLPLKLFTKGYLCHPYLSLHYMDLLSDSRVRGFIVGATNILFKQKRDLADVIVEMEDGSVEISCPILKKVVTLTTQDLRFADSIVRNVTQENGRKSDPTDNFLDGVGWEGGDEWIRSQFKYYLMCLMRTSQLEEGHRQRDSFGSGFIRSWQNTHHWKIWDSYVNSEERDTPGIYLLSPGHPFDGQISMSDMKLRFSHLVNGRSSMQTTDSGRKINEAVGKAVASTGKAVGGALTQAKGAFSNWWSSVTTTGIPLGTEETVPASSSSDPGANIASSKVNNSSTSLKDEALESSSNSTASANIDIRNPGNRNFSNPANNEGRQSIWYRE